MKNENILNYLVYTNNEEEEIHSQRHLKSRRVLEIIMTQRHIYTSHFSLYILRRCLGA